MSIKYLNLLFAGFVAVTGYFLFAAGGALVELQLPTDYDFPFTRDADGTWNEMMMKLNFMIDPIGKAARLSGALLFGLGVVYALTFCFVVFRGRRKPAAMALLAAMLIPLWLLPGDADAAPGDTFRDCERCPLIVEIPPGSFMMGSPPSEEGRDDSEGPVRKVRIAYKFAVGVFEIRFADWEVCLADGGCDGYEPDDKGWGRGRRPVINVTWEHAQAYVKWLSAKTGHAYRLLSEAEWEYVARAGTTTPFHTGETISTEQANYDGDYAYGSGAKGIYREQTVAAGTFPPNAFGVYDMHGNVLEWVQDCWGSNYLGAPVDGSAWDDWEMDCSKRVLRGGAWYFTAHAIRSATRADLGASSHLDLIGFRVARTLTR